MNDDTTSTAPAQPAADTRTFTARSSDRPEAPYVWASAGWLRRIRERFQSRVLLTYIGMATIASEERRATFTASVVRIAKAATLRYRATWESISELESVGAITIDRHREADAPKNSQGRTVHRSGAEFTYTLATFARGAKPPLQQTQTTFARDERRPAQTGLNSVSYSETEREAGGSVPPVSGGLVETRTLTGAEKINLESRFKRIEARIEEIKRCSARNAMGDPLYTDEERQELAQLRPQLETLGRQTGFYVKPRRSRNRKATSPKQTEADRPVTGDRPVSPEDFEKLKRGLQALDTEGKR